MMVKDQNIKSQGLRFLHVGIPVIIIRPQSKFPPRRRQCQPIEIGFEQVNFGNAVRDLPFQY